MRLGEQLSREEVFIKKATDKHGDKYDYSKVVYKNNTTPVNIVCNKCGTVFSKTPKSHLIGAGCPDCKSRELSERFRMSKEEFVKRATELHKGKYDYSLVKSFSNRNDTVTIICPIHREFKQTVANHLAGGCYKCGKRATAKKMRKSKDRFIEDATQLHGDIYDYSEVEYVNTHTPVTIICKSCGCKFLQQPANHLCGNGCPECSTSGFRQSTKESCLYLLVDDLTIPTVIKVGVTINLQSRLYNIRRNTNFPVHVLKVFTFEQGCATIQLEKLVHKVFADRNCHFEGFDGATEWFWYSHDIVEFLEDNC